MSEENITIDDLVAMVQKGFTETAKKIDMEAGFKTVNDRLDKIENVCPKCAVELHKKIGAVSVVFKGSGFYATEYGKSKGNAFTKDKSEIAEREKFIEEAKKGPC